MSNDGWDSPDQKFGGKSSSSGGDNKSGFGGNSSSGFSGNKSSGFGDKPSGFGGKPSGFGDKPSGFGGKPSGFGDKPSGFGDKPSGFGDKPSGFGDKPAGFGNKPTGFGGNSGGSGFQDNGSSSSSKPAGFGDNKSSFGGGSQGFGSKPTNFGEDQNSFGGGSSGFGSRQTGFGDSQQSFGGGNSGFGGSGGGGSGFGGNRNGGERSRDCFNCGEPGHNSRDCEQPRKERNCYNCQQPGHNSRDCPEERRPREHGGQRRDGDGFQNRGFGSGGENGFPSGNGDREPRGDTGFGSTRGGFGGDGNGESRGPMKCFKCNQEGHKSADCDEEPKCFNCQQTGHTSRDCDKPREQREGEGPRATYIPEEEGVETIFDLQKIMQGVMFDKFFEAEVTYSSGGRSEKVMPVKLFSESGLTERLLKNVTQAGYLKTTPIQQYSIPLIRNGKDIMACAQTGSGKTAAFLLPIMSELIKKDDMNTVGECGCYPRCLILTPTRELADQIYNEGRKFAFQTIMEIKPVYGGLAVGYNRGQLERGSSIIVGTVGRVKHFIEEGIISLSKIKYVVLDEADRMIDSMGFGDEIDKIINHPTMPSKENRQTVMFSATFPDSVQHAARAYLREDYGMVTIDKIGAANKCVVQEFVRCSRGEKMEKLLELVGVDLNTYTTSRQAEIYTKKTMIFVAQRVLADTLAAQLSQSQIPAITIHGAREQKERSEALRQFRNGSKPILIATAVAERGLDIKGVDHVINYDLPDNIDDYVHRIGRTGRVGNSGRSTSFVTDENLGLVPALLKILGDAEQMVPPWMTEIGGGSFGFGGGNVPTQEEEEAW